MKVVAYIRFDATINGNAAEVRKSLTDLLSDEDVTEVSTDGDLPELEEPATQDDFSDINITLSIDDIQVDDCVEVYWKGDRVWYEGRIIFVDVVNKQFEVEYFLDNNKKLLHNSADYKVRQTC